TAQRRRFRAYHVALLEQLVARLREGAAERDTSLETWLRHAPFDRRVHELILRSLAQKGQLKEGDEHLAAAARSFEAEGLDWLPLREIWRDAKARQSQVAVSAASAAPIPQEAPSESRPAMDPTYGQ